MKAGRRQRQDLRKINHQRKRTFLKDEKLESRMRVLKKQTGEKEMDQRERKLRTRSWNFQTG